MKKLSSNMKHMHHIIPRHMGGTDDPSNLVELTVEEHAEAHRILYEQYGREEDRMAWLGLSGQASKKEICVLGYKLGRKKTDQFLEQKYGSNWRKIFNDIIRLRAIEVLKERMENDPVFAEKARLSAKRASDSALTRESKEKRKKTFAKIKHQHGHKNSQYGTMWITNGIDSKKIRKNDLIPEGWKQGRKM